MISILDFCNISPFYSFNTALIFYFVKMCCPFLATLMSGSPIVKNGKLARAVTHVLVADPTEGYGIFIENMMKASQTARNELPAA